MYFYQKSDGSVLQCYRKVPGLTEIAEDEFFAAIQAVVDSAPARAEAEYWANVSYDEAVNAKIRERYSETQEFAILRQQTAKPEEYAEYYAYCEECKSFVKEKKGME